MDLNSLGEIKMNKQEKTRKNDYDNNNNWKKKCEKVNHRNAKRIAERLDFVKL